MSTTSRSAIHTSLELNATTYATTIAALALAMERGRKQSPKFERIAARILSHEAPTGEQVVRVHLNLRQLCLVRRALKNALVVAFEANDPTFGSAVETKLVQVQATVLRRLPEAA